MKIDGIEKINSLPFSSERKKFLEESQTLPYQRINDSPTVKHYTDWNAFESAQLRLNVDGVSVKLNGLSEANDLSSGFPHDTKLVPLIEALSVKRKAVHSGDGRVEIEARDGSLVPLNLEVELTDSSQLTLRANSRSGSLSAFLVSIHVPKGVTAKVNVIVDSDSSSLVYARLRIHNEGELNLNLVSSAAKAARIEADVHLMERASSKFLARSIGIEGTVDNVVNVYHEGPESVSDGTLKGAAFGNAQVAVRGLASILEKAYDSSTSIIGRSYVQGSGARTIVVPMLEVKTGRVKMAKHSASAMKVPEDLLFYLQSRGFDRREANAIILRGFMESPDDTEEVRAFIESLLSKVL